MPSTKNRVVIYVDPDNLDFLKKWAKEDHRTVSNLVSMLVDEAIKNKQTDKVS